MFYTIEYIIKCDEYLFILVFFYFELLSLGIKIKKNNHRF